MNHSLSRLGVKAEIMTKVGDDAYGTMIIDELAGDGLDTSHVIRKKGISSPFTYVIVDIEGQTRTCIHTPSEDMKEEEISESLLDGVSFLHLDGRNTLYVRHICMSLSVIYNCILNQRLLSLILVPFSLLTRLDI